MQKGKATTSPPAMVLQGRPPQQNPRGPPNSQQRPEDFNPRQNQPYQIAGPLPQNLMMQAMPGQMQGPHAQGQPRLPNQQFYQRSMRIPRPPPPSNQPVYSSPPGAPVVQMIGHPGTAQFLAPGQPGPFIPQHVDFQLPMAGPPHYRQPQAMQGQFPPVSGPSQPHGPFMYQQSPGYPIGQPSPPVYIVRAPANPLQGMQQFQPQFEPRTRERKIIQIKDPNSNKDVTQEILKRQPASSLTSTAVGTPNNTPDLSGQSSSSSTPPLTSQQQAEANVRAQFAAQVAATLANNSEDRPKKQEYTIQKATVNNRGDVDIVKAKGTLEVQKEEALKGARKNDTVSNVVEKVQETQMKEGTVPVKSQPKEAVKASKLCEGSSGESLLGSKSLVTCSSVDATTVANGKISNVSCRVEIFTEEVLYKESQKSNAPFVSDVVKTDEKVKPSDECDKDEKVKPSDECDKDEKVKPSDECDKDEKVQLLDECEKDEKVKVVDECEEDEKVKRLDEGEKEVATDALPVSESKIVNGPMEESQEQAKEDTEEVITIDSQPEVEAAVPGTASETLEPNKVSEDNGKELTQPEETFVQTEESEVLLPSSVPQEGSGNEKVNGHEVDLKKSAVASTPVDSHGSVPPKDMKKKKQKHRIREMEKRSSEKETDMMEAYTEKPVQQETPDEGEEQPAEETTELQQEVQVTEDAQSDDDTWETKEEMEEVSDQQPDGEKRTYMYDRDFLLQFQTNPMCLQKPDGLPDLEVVLVQARAPSKPGFQQNRMPKVDGGENTFLPAYMRQGSKNDRNMRGNRSRNVQPKKVIEFPSVQQQPDLKRVDNRWVRPSEASKSGNEEETKTEELYRKVRSILNKLTPQKFQTLIQQISELEIDTPERLEGAIDLIFEKAIDEANFSVAYANMCKCLLNKKVVVEKEGVKKDVSFRKILLNKCQKEFEREKSVEKTIHEKLEDLTKQGLSKEELQSRKRDLQDEERQQKRRTLGNIRFIGELFKLKMLTESIMHDCVVKLLKSNDEESFECLCKLLVTIGKDLDHKKAKPRVDQYFKQINKIISARITSSRVRFMMQDIVDLRSNGWVPRREDNIPMTIDQIHRAAANQAKKTLMAIQIARHDKRLQQRGNKGGRDSPRPGAIPQADKSWTTVVPRNVSVDPKKFQNIKRASQDRGSGRESPRTTEEVAQATDSAAGTAALAASQEVTQELMKKKSLSIIDEFLNIKDMKEVAECLKELQSPSRHHVFVEVTFNYTMEKRASERRATGKLIHFLMRYGVLTAQHYLNGLESIFEVAEDTEIDVPQLWKYLGELIGPTAFDGNLGLDELFKCVFKYVSKHKAARLFACILQSSEKSPQDVRAFLDTCNVTVYTFFDDADEAREFAKDRSIEYALGPSPPSSQISGSTSTHSANVEEQLRTVILKTKARNEEVMDWIDRNVSPSSTKESPFIRALVTVVCEGALYEDDEGSWKCNVDELKERKNLLQKYIDANTSLEVQALYAVQALYLRQGHPQGFVKSYFDSLYDEEIISGESFHTWESSLDEEPGKGVTVMAASEFFRCLKSALEENDEDERIGSGTGEWKGGQFFVCSKDFREEIALQEPQEKELQQENLERQLVVLQQQLREKEQCLANYRAQLEERNLTETNLIQQLQQQEHQQENSQRQLQKMEEQIRENKDDKANLEKQLEVLQQQLSENEQCLAIYRAQLAERRFRESRLIRQLQEKELQGENSQKLLQEMEEQIREKEDDKANSERQLREMVQSFEERIRGKEEQKTNLETQLGMKNQELREIETSLSAAQQMIIELRRQESCDWAISRDEIQVKDKYLGKGAWGSVNEATYCGCIVAVKQIHELILSPHNRRLFEREMNIASRCRHPCLLQFIGATNDEGSPLFVTELMELSLRALLEQRQLTETEISVISLDVSRALNYLHHMKPSPIVHRDVSSANVLLWRQGEQWRGKVSDYGTAKFVQQTMTVAPGALIYSAPEAVSSNQTSKVDVYSFGVLLCEMCIREMPDPERREEQVLLVKNRNFRNLVRQCLQAEPAMRPDMAQIIQELEQV